MSVNEKYIKHWSRTDIDPVRLVGGQLEAISKNQFEMLKSAGLEPQHRYLDIGCGCVRGGRLIEKYLDKGNYWGIDISQFLIEEGKKHVQVPEQLMVAHSYEYDKLVPGKFDYVVLFSVFTHVYEQDIITMLAEIGKVLADGGKCIPSIIWCSEDNESTHYGNIAKMTYKKSYIEELWGKCGWKHTRIIPSITDCELHKIYVLEKADVS